MRLLDLIFDLIFRFVPMKQEDWAKLKDEAEQDVRTWHPEHDNKWKAMYAKHTNHWMTRTAFAIAYVPLVRWIGDWMNPTTKDEDED